MENKKLKQLIKEFNENKKEYEKKLPYQINLIDELHINENAHSRILAKILNFNENGKYPFLESFFKYLGSDFSEIKIKDPIITNENYRIDVLIEENNEYAVIIENKIYGATDQKNQINDYIKKIKEYVEGIIYVLYLTKDGGAPSMNSLRKAPKKKLGKRYKEINYKNDILPWLTENVLPECKFKDQLLISSIQQYIDYLNGMFLMRESEQGMLTKINMFLLKKLKINGTLYKKISKIKGQISLIKESAEINKDTIEILEYLNNILKNYIIDIHKIWFEKLKKQFKNAKFASNIFDHEKEKITQLKYIRDTYLYFGIRIKYKDEEALCAIGFDKYSSKPYYGLTIRSCSDMKSEKLSEIHSLRRKSGRWYGYNYEDLDKIFNKFCTFYKDIL